MRLVVNTVQMLPQSKSSLVPGGEKKQLLTKKGSLFSFVVTSLKKKKKRLISKCQFPDLQKNFLFATVIIVFTSVYFITSELRVSKQISLIT